MSRRKWSRSEPYALLESAKVFDQVDLSKFSNKRNACHELSIVLSTD